MTDTRKNLLILVLATVPGRIVPVHPRHAGCQFPRRLIRPG